MLRVVTDNSYYFAEVCFSHTYLIVFLDKMIFNRKTVLPIMYVNCVVNYIMRTTRRTKQNILSFIVPFREVVGKIVSHHYWLKEFYINDIDQFEIMLEKENSLRRFT